jgi:hypothetical protein
MLFTKGRMNRWLARLAMSFFIIAAVLAWSAYQALQHHAETWRVAVDLFGAAAAVTMGVVGIRAKHSQS